MRILKYCGVTGAVDEVRHKLETETIEGYNHRCLPKEYELKHYVLNEVDKASFKEGLYWIDESLSLVAGERLFLNITKERGEFKFVKGYYRTKKAHVCILYKGIIKWTKIER